MNPLNLWFSETIEDIVQIFPVFLLVCILQKVVLEPEEPVKCLTFSLKKDPVKPKDMSYKVNRRHCNLRTNVASENGSFLLLLTSSCDEPMSNLNPGKTAGLGSELRENGKPGDLVSEVS